MTLSIGNYTINQESPTFIIAELSANHGHNKQVALDTVKAAKQAGADAIKLQTYTADTITLDCDNDYFKISHGTIWQGRNLHDLYKEAHTPWDWHKEIFEAAKEEGLVCFSSPFDKTAVDFLEDLDAPAYKIASFEIQDIPLIEYAASKGKPMIMSTGIAQIEDIELAVETCRKAGNEQIILLKCTSSYPAPIELANLRTMVDMGQKFDVMVGLSDHTIGNTVPVTATALGGKVIEKHFILDKSIGGPDADFSLNPAEFKEMVDEVRLVEQALGTVTYQLADKVEKNRKFARSLFVMEDIKAGTPLTEANIRSIRPGYGMHPKYYKQVLGKVAAKDLKRGEPLQASDVEQFSAE